jgi:NADH/F420H2 dehydrogenase subunit C
VEDSSGENVAKASPITDLLIKTFPDAVSPVEEQINWPAARIKLDALQQVAAFLKETPDLAFDYLTCISGVDLEERSPRFDVVYHLVSLTHNHMLVLKVGVEEGQKIPSMTSIWKGADWNEREVFDLFGLSFIGHPDLRRILLPDEWKGHPLRKDYVIAEEDKFPGD